MNNNSFSSNGTKLDYDRTTGYVSNSNGVVGTVNSFGDIITNDGGIYNVNQFGDVVDMSGNVKGKVNEGRVIMYDSPKTQDSIQYSSSSSATPILSKSTKRKIFLTLLGIGISLPILFAIVMVISVIAESGEVIEPLLFGIFFILSQLGPIILGIGII